MIAHDYGQDLKLLGFKTHQLCKCFKIVNIYTVMVLGIVKDKHTFSNLHEGNEFHNEFGPCCAYVCINFLPP
jgi:hypothetical protein